MLFVIFKTSCHCDFHSKILCLEVCYFFCCQVDEIGSVPQMGQFHFGWRWSNCWDNRKPQMYHWGVCSCELNKSFSVKIKLIDNSWASVYFKSMYIWKTITIPGFSFVAVPFWLSKCPNPISVARDGSWFCFWMRDQLAKSWRRTLAVLWHLWQM